MSEERSPWDEIDQVAEAKALMDGLDMEQKLATWEREFQPYFVAYAASLGVTPEVAASTFRGHEFIIWINQRWSDWDAITHAGKSPSWRSDAEHAAFGEWLAAGCPAETEAAL